MSNALKKIQSWDGSGKPGRAPKPPEFKVGDLVKHAEMGRGTILKMYHHGEGYATVDFGPTDEKYTVATAELVLVTSPLAKKLARIVCHDNPNRTMHLGVTCQLSMTVKEFNAMMQKAAKALNNGRKV